MDEVETLSYDECISAGHINATPNNEMEMAIIEHKKKLFDNFKPLLKHYIDSKTEKRISSEEMVQLWQFYLQGTRVLIFKQEMYDYNHIHEEADRFRPLLKATVEDVMKCPFRYQIAYHFLASSTRIKEAERQYETIYKDESDPIQWYVKNSNSFTIDSKINKDLLKLWNIIYMVENTKFDPVLQA
jgi:hypothetical protein